MKKHLIAASAMLLLTSGAALAVPVSPTDVSASINGALDKVARTSTSTLLQQPPVGGVSAVPLPAAGWMLLAGIGGIVALRRRAKA